MPLPTSIPGGADKPKASQPAEKDETLPSLPALPPREEKGLPRPQGGLPTPPRQQDLPTPPAKPAPRRPAGTPAARPAPAQTAAPAAPRPQAQTGQEALPEGWAIDPKTGVKYRTLAPSGPEAVKAFEKGGRKGLTLDQLRTFVPEADFDVDDLNGAANEFLAHLRVPVPKEEIEAARRARAVRRAASDGETG